MPVKTKASWSRCSKGVVDAARKATASVHDAVGIVSPKRKVDPHPRTFRARFEGHADWEGHPRGEGRDGFVVKLGLLFAWELGVMT